VVFGGPGNNAQHAYYQLLHQGTQLVPCDLIVAGESSSSLPGHQRGVLANALAQAEAFMRGRTEEEAFLDLVSGGATEEEARRLAPHKAMPGDRPTTMLLYRRLTPTTLGALVALYEHKVFVQSVIWDVNPFDQWGVELGKTLARRLEGELGGGHPGDHDASTLALIRRLRAWTE
jgi:glucose-6-phosphate isomerase